MDIGTARQELENLVEHIKGSGLLELLSAEEPKKEFIRFVSEETGVSPIWVKMLVGALQAATTAGAKAVGKEAWDKVATLVLRIPGAEDTLLRIKGLFGDAVKRAEFKKKLRDFADKGGPAPKPLDDTAEDVRLGLALLAEFRDLRSQSPTLDELHRELTAFADTIESRLGPKPNLVTFENTGTRLHFRLRRVDVRGRERELTKLGEFLETPEPFRWAVVTGAGGVGKSRLALELCISAHEGRGWRSGFLERTKGFSEWDRWHPVRPTLIVIDYVQERADAIGTMLASLCARALDPQTRIERQLDDKVRVLLLERRAGEKEEWWDRMLKRAPRDQIASARFDDPLLELATIDDAALYASMEQIAAEKSKRLPPQDVTIKNLADIDPQKRPLFAAMAADAFAERGDFNFSRDQLLDDVIKHELEMLWPQDQGGSNDDILREKNLLALATMVHGVFSKQIQVITKNDFRNLFPPKGMGGVLKISENFRASAFDQERDLYRPLEPDIVGTWFALNHPRTTGHGSQIRGKLHETAWRMTPPRTLAYAVFLSRAAQDFPGVIGANGSVFVEPPPDNVPPIAFLHWAMLVVDLVGRFGEVEALRGRADEVFRDLWRVAGERNKAELWLQTAQAVTNLVGRFGEVEVLRSRADEVFRDLWQVATTRDEAALWLETAKAATNLVGGFGGVPELRGRADEVFRALWQIAGVRNQADLWLPTAQAAANLVARFREVPERRDRADEVVLDLWRVVGGRNEPDLQRIIVKV